MNDWGVMTYSGNSSSEDELSCPRARSLVSCCPQYHHPQTVSTLFCWCHGIVSVFVFSIWQKKTQKSNFAPRSDGWWCDDVGRFFSLCCCSSFFSCLMLLLLLARHHDVDFSANGAWSCPGHGADSDFCLVSAMDSDSLPSWEATAEEAATQDSGGHHLRAHARGGCTTPACAQGSTFLQRGGHPDSAELSEFTQAVAGKLINNHYYFEI